MDPRDAQAFKQRWKRVAAAEREELARMSAAQKFADIGMLMSVARSLDGSADENAGAAAVRRRWNLLVERMGG